MSGSASLRSHSIEIIRNYQHESGAYIASPSFGVYKYSWFRDGSFIAEAMRTAGETDSAARFHAWAAGVLVQRASQMQRLIDRSLVGDEPGPEEHLHCRYNLDGTTSEEEWTNFQLDGFGTWLWAVARFHTDDAPPEVRAAVNAVVPYLAQFWKVPSFDWWEESPGHIHVSSVGCIAVGLEALAGVPWVDFAIRGFATSIAAEIRQAIDQRGVVDGRLRKWFDGDGVDASTLALVAPMELLDASTELARLTVAEVRNRLADPGVHRHPDDTYFGGGQWLLLTAMLGLGECALGDTALAESRLAWIEAQAEPNGDLPEQVSTSLLHPEYEQRWIDRWGPVATPLLWSHAMYILLHDALGETA
jgi:GH15 family glucan-1,4-alpha-glucosidase